MMSSSFPPISVFGAFAAYIKLSHPDVRTVYMIGEDGLEEELEMVGLRVVKEEARPAPGMTEDEFRDNDIDPEVCGVCQASHGTALFV